MNTEEIPFFDDQANKIIPGRPMVERDVASSVVYNPKTHSVLCLVWNSNVWKTLVNGGIEEGEDVIEGAKREILEETGYKDLKFIANLGKARSRFFASHKDENRLVNATGLLFELVSDDQEPVSDEEKENHLPEWVPVDKVAEFVNIDWQLYFWEKAQTMLSI